MPSEPPAGAAYLVSESRNKQHNQETKTDQQQRINQLRVQGAWNILCQYHETNPDNTKQGLLLEKEVAVPHTVCSQMGTCTIDDH